MIIFINHLLLTQFVGYQSGNEANQKDNTLNCYFNDRILYIKKEHTAESTTSFQHKVALISITHECQPSPKSTHLIARKFPNFLLISNIVHGGSAQIALKFVTSLATLGNRSFHCFHQTKSGLLNFV